MRTNNKTSVLLVYCIVLFLAFPDKYMQITASSYSTLSYGIDVSCFQGSIDWNKVGTSSIDFAIIRAGTTSINGEAFSNDSTFERNYNGAVNAGLKVGAYYYCGAYSESGFIKNAYDVLEAIEGKSFDYPVYIDVELASKQMELGKSTLTSYILSALDIISSRGYQAGVYANLDWLNNYVDASRIRERGYDIWLAQYPSGSYTVDPTNYDKSDECSIWQYSNLGSISGISGNVDVDVSYVENEQIPKKNPYPRPTGEPAIEKGMTGPEVGWLQYELNNKGYDIGSCGIDCDFGEDTENAVKAFQSDNSLAPDGIVDFETINALSPISPAHHPPEGYLDSVEGGEGCVVVEGWAYDADTPDEAVEIHVYMDGGPGVGTGFGGIFANEPSENVNTILGYPGNHRFSATIQLDDTGTHTFSAFAIDRGGGHDNTRLINEFTVEVLPVKRVPDELKVEETSVTLHKGESYQIKCNQSNVAYFSNKPAVADVSADGTVTAHNVGSATITVTNGDADKVEISVTVADKSVKGDCNGDGILSAADMVLLEKWLLGAKDAALELHEEADLLKDGVIDTFDLICMRKLIIEHCS